MDKEDIVISKKDSRGNIIYEEDANGNYNRYEYDEKKNMTYFEVLGTYDGTEERYKFWEKTTYDGNNNKIYKENSLGGWTKFRHLNDIVFITSSNTNDPQKIQHTIMCKYGSKYIRIKAKSTSELKDIVSTINLLTAELEEETIR